MVPEGLRIKLNEIKDTLIDNNVLYSKNLPTIYPDTPIQDLSNVLNQDEDFFRNSFFPELLKRIVKVQVENLSYTNPLRYLKGEDMPLGGISQHIMVNRVQGRQFNCDDFAGLLAKYKADIKVVYNSINWDYQYPVTITFDNVRDAFTSWDKLYNFTDAISQSLINSAEIDDYNLTKRLMTNAYANNQVPMVTVTAPTDEDTANALIKTLRMLYKKMQFASTAYNGWSLNGGYGLPATTWSRPEDVVVAISADVDALLSVDTYAKAFNLDEAKLMGRVIVIDDFSIYNDDGSVAIDGSNIVAMIGDRKWFAIDNQMRRFNQSFNANNETWQLYLHVREAFNTLPFANMVALVTATPTIAATAVNFEEDSLTVTAGNSVVVNVKTTPVQATTEITYSVKKGNAASTDITAIPSSNGRTVTLETKPTATGDYTVTATAGQVTGSITVTVNAAAAQAANVEVQNTKANTADK